MAELRGMKLTGKCPMCGNAKVIIVPGRTYGHDFGPNVPAGFWSNADVDRYICDACGFMEHWVRNSEELAKIRRKYANDEG